MKSACHASILGPNGPGPLRDTENGEDRMDAKKTIKKYICGRVGSRWMARVLFVVAFLSLVLALITSDVDTLMPICLICLLFGLCAMVPGLITSRNAKKTIKALEESGHLGRAANEMEAANNILLGKDQLRLTPNYVFSRNGVALPYSEIVWCFKRVQRVNFIAVNASLVAYTPTMKELVLLTLPPKDKTELGRQVVEAICRRNPNVMLGYSAENQKAYKQIAKEAKANKLG